jgi:hypothetical protein
MMNIPDNAPGGYCDSPGYRNSSELFFSKLEAPEHEIAAFSPPPENPDPESPESEICKSKFLRPRIPSDSFLCKDLITRSESSPASKTFRLTTREEEDCEEEVPEYPVDEIEGVIPLPEQHRKIRHSRSSGNERFETGYFFGVPIRYRRRTVHVSNVGRPGGPRRQSKGPYYRR